MQQGTNTTKADGPIPTSAKIILSLYAFSGLLKLKYVHMPSYQIPQPTKKLFSLEKVEPFIL